MTEEVSDQPLLLFDGVCNLCNGVVRFTAERDNGLYSFAPLQSDRGQEILQRNGMEKDSFNTFVILEDDKLFTRSEAAVKLLKNLDGFWPYVGLLLGLIPSPIRDLGYRFIAKIRYKVFGKKEQCMVPDGDIEQRFLDG